jgi:hypothetical protein
MLVPVVDGRFGGADRSCDGQVGIDFGLRDDGQSGSQGTTVKASVEDRGSQTEQWSKVLAKVPVGNGALDEKEHEQDVQESLDAWTGETQCRRALIIDDDGLLQILEDGFADEAVVTDALDVEQTSVGRKGDFAQLRQVFDASADGEVAGVIDGGFG